MVNISLLQRHYVDPEPPRGRSRYRLKKTTIVALARKLLVALREYVNVGVGIEGAVMKTAWRHMRTEFYNLPWPDQSWRVNFLYQAESWIEPRRVVAKVGWHPGELILRAGLIVTSLSRPAERVVAFFNQRGTCEQWIKEGKSAIKWTRLS